MSEHAWKWLHPGKIVLNEDEGNLQHFMKRWCHLTLTLKDFKVNYTVQEYNEDGTSLPVLPLTKDGMRDTEKELHTKIEYDGWSGHQIRGQAEIVENTVMWSNFAKGHPGGDMTDQINQNFEAAEVFISARRTEKPGEMRVQYGPDYGEPSKLVFYLNMEAERLAKVAHEAVLPGERPSLRVSVLASLFHYVAANGESSSTYLFPASAPNVLPV